MLHGRLLRFLGWQGNSGFSSRTNPRPRRSSIASSQRAFALAIVAVTVSLGPSSTPHLLQFRRPSNNCAVILVSTRANKTKPTPGGECLCQKCGAQYEVTLWRRPKEAQDYATCQRCRSVMLEWCDSVARSFKI